MENSLHHLGEMAPGDDKLIIKINKMSILNELNFCFFLTVKVVFPSHEGTEYENSENIPQIYRALTCHMDSI